MGTNSAPSPQELQTLITQHALDRVGVLEKLLSHAPDSALPSLLLALVDAGIEDNSSGTCTTLKQLLSQPSVSKVCGKVFQKGDLVWTCKQCGKDGTCVLCHACFERSHHPTLLPHHEVYFHRNQSGSGCCDCGDPEAWKKEGCCALHSEDLEASGEDTKDLTSLLPLPLRENLSAVLKSLMRLLANHCIQTLLGHNPRCEIGLQGEEEGVFVLRLHNDDVHDFEEVTTALMTCGMTRIQATGLTNKVDREGSAAVRQGAWSEVFWMASELLAANLLVSIVAKDVHEKDLRMAAALHWLTSLAANENVRRLVTEILLLPLEDCEHYPLRLPYLNNLPSSVTSLFPSINGPLQSRIPVIALSLLMISSPFQVKDMQTALNSLVLKYQHDTLFKKAFTQLLCSVYPSLSLLFARFVGTDAESLLNTTVQVFTSASMADLMSSEGVGHRIFPEADAATPVYILPHLMRSLRVCLLDAGADAVGGITAPSTAFLAQNVLTKSRLLRVCRDIEYVASNASTVRVLQKVRDPSAMEEWLCVLCLLQELYPMRRQRGDHVEREDGQWQTAASLVLEIESVSDALIRGAFALPQPQMGSSSLGGRLDSTPIDGRAVAALAVLDIAEVICRRLVPTLESTVPNSRQFLGHTVTLPAKLTPPTLLSGNTDVSILLPLHRFAAKLIGAALKANVNLGPVLNNLKSNLLMSLGLLELPLKSLAWFAQVSVGMWRRNGDAVSSLAYNYSRIALGKHMMDADIMLIQTSMLSLGSDVMLITLLDCLELVEVLDSGVTTKEKREYAGPLIAEFLRLLILIITKLPVTLSSEMILKEALKRQVAPLLLSGATLPSMVDSCRRSFKDVTVGPETSNGCRSITIEELVREVVKELASTREAITINAETPSMMLLTPNPASLLYFNCEDTLLPRAELEKATELVRALQKQAPQQDLTSRPMVDRKALAFASASPSFVFVLSLLQSPLFLLILDKIIELIIRAEHRSFTDSRALILGRVLYLLTLQLHSISLEEACICWESETGKAIFQKILTIREGNMVAADEMHLQGLAWIMEELSTKVPAIQRELVAKGYGKSTGSSLTRTDESSRRRRKVRAQRQSMDEIQSRAAKFMAEMELEGGKNANEEASIEERKVLHLDQAGEEEEDVLDLPVCVVCRESEAESSCSMDANPLGYFTFLQPSTVLKHATARDIHENRFVVVLEEEAFIFSSPSLDAMKVGRLLHGDIVDISSREGRWVQIQEPAVASHLSSTRRDTACRLWVQVYTDSHGEESGGVRVRPVLFPLAELCFNQFGPSRLFVSTCGHAIHAKCLTRLRASVRTSRVEEVALNFRDRENLCPLCKAVSNCILPHLTQLKAPKNALRASSSSSPTEDFLFRSRGSRNDLQELLDGLLRMGDHTLGVTGIYPSVEVAQMVNDLMYRCGSLWGRRGEEADAYALASAVSYTLFVSASASYGKHFYPPPLLLLKHTLTCLRATCSPLRRRLILETFLQDPPPSAARAHRSWAAYPPTRCGLLQVLNSSEIPKPSETFHIIDKPLLTQDVCPLLVLCLGSCNIDDNARALSIVQLMIIVRLLQILIEAPSCNRGLLLEKFTHDEASLHLDHSLGRLRDEVYNAAGLPFVEGRPVGSLLRHAVAQSLLPFVEYCRCFLPIQRSQTENTLSQKEDKINLLHELDALLLLHHLRPLEELLCLEAVLGLGSLLGAQLRPHFGENIQCPSSGDSMQAQIGDGANLIDATETIVGGGGGSILDEPLLNPGPILDDMADLEVLPDRMVAMLSSLQRQQHALSISEATESGSKAWRLLGLDPDVPHHSTLSLPFSVLLNGVHPICASSDPNRRTPVIADFSHLRCPIGTRKYIGLTILPSDFSEFYNSALAVVRSNSFDPETADAAVCLLCGRVVAAGNRGSAGSGLGECTLHAKGCGAGVGVYQFCNRGNVLLISGDLSVLRPSLYVDRYGEVDKTMGFNRPLTLSSARYQQLEALYVRHEIPMFVARQRYNHRGQAIRNGWF